MFKSLFKKNIEYTENTEEIVAPCDCEGEREHCDLILRLRKCQNLRKEIKNEIEILENDNHELICNFINFLKKLEENGVKMERFEKRQWLHYSNTSIIKRTIEELSSADIFRITEELRVYKNKEDIICEKQRALKAVEDDIKNIKTKLGIE